jgi:hypothetical protein
MEARASATPGIEFVALRYGFFYGPGTWYTREGDIDDQVRQQQVPIIGEGQGVYSFVHIDDAAGASQAPTRSTTRRGLGALRTRRPGASLSSVRARSSGFRSKIGLTSVGIDHRMNLAGQPASPAH